MSNTLFGKIWATHEIMELHGRSLLYIDKYFLDDGSAVLSYEQMEAGSLEVRNPEQALSLSDHYVPSRPTAMIFADMDARRMSESAAKFAAKRRMPHFGFGHPYQGISHVVGIEQGFSLPGVTLVCGDSHTATHGAVGALAFGIGSTEITQVMATQALWQTKPKTMRINVDGQLGMGVEAKDVILAIIGTIGTKGASGYAVEYAGSTIGALGIAQRATICNMSIEAGAKIGMVAPDDVTLKHLFGLPFAPVGDFWDQAVLYWRTLRSDSDAKFDREVHIDATAIEPVVTWGTSPEDVLPISGCVPDPANEADPDRKRQMLRSIEYMGLVPGVPLCDLAIDRVFIGSCTNSRIEDLRAAAAVVRGRQAVVPSWVVPGSQLIRSQAEREGLDQIFIQAGFEWRLPGCSMCCANNGDFVAPGERCASTSNRNFIGRQGPDARTHLLSPTMAAAAAVTGRLTDVRRLPRLT